VDAPLDQIGEVARRNGEVVVVVEDDDPVVGGGRRDQEIGDRLCSVCPMPNQPVLG
jgi:hypothetical protein